ncbi:MULTISPECIES: 16S rRNA (guanine(527)-N(7))-methyltransferase RsmG [unclassified Devosia]|jgi:16S rRNA (guanine527-N7)-methyltransferase|uniref:16S rRNA (guanine(527)-N(7))-methyltransferase RsmG n=1 Tax=unclassified Devosia TaxID=196773 RepID=UPI0009686660|nr:MULTISPECIES: 16S rRNA (guanine(527)-N(7))-methyltransferase RsmG [unclassified Devosia]MBN9362264.1 16S rRNA (guanine(527)-N(7))-methyltransferase RsmG [Devosia sp.]OJX24487.1 MAG: 16S rRNA (guanine(527)-N(7))-methyltransferase RsmG [Devosia sp. 66-14]
MGELSPYSDGFARPEAAVRRDLESFAALLKKWNAVQNLVSRETENALWSRHVVDSLQILPLFRPSDTLFLDVGSGGGLPALPLAIALKGGPARFTLVEPIGKKVAFLRQVIRELGLPAAVHAGRTDDFDSRETLGDGASFDVITSRALAALPLLLELIHPFFGPETRAILHKGRDHAVEVEESRLAWDFDVVITKSATDEAGVLLEISNLRRKSTR